MRRRLQLLTGLFLKIAERAAIEEWMAKSNTSPMTGKSEQLPLSTLNAVLKLNIVDSRSFERMAQLGHWHHAFACERLENAACLPLNMCRVGVSPLTAIR